MKDIITITYDELSDPKDKGSHGILPQLLAPARLEIEVNGRKQVITIRDNGTVNVEKAGNMLVTDTVTSILAKENK